jgi:hypothetical protein
MIYSEYVNATSHDISSAPVEIPAGQTGKVRTYIVNGISAAYKIVLRAEDPNHAVIWQKTWTGKEFASFIQSTSIYIVVSLGTN